MLGNDGEIAEKFSGLESRLKSARASISYAYSLVRNLDDALGQGTIHLNQDQAYMVAACIERAARFAANDNNYGCGVIGTGIKEKVAVNTLMRGHYIDLMRTEEKSIMDSLKEAGDNPLKKIPLMICLDRVKRRLEYAEKSPDNSFFRISEDTVEVELEIGSELDRKYWHFTDAVVRDANLRRVSPELAREYERVRKDMITSAPSLCLNHNVYSQLKKEFPFLHALDDPRAFQALLEVVGEKGGLEKIYVLLTGNEVNGKTMQRFNYAMQRVGGFLGLPNEFVDGR
jgi:hypothetical protein